jgi:hypothetical protein
MRLLLDEHLAPLFRSQLQRRLPDLIVSHVGDPGAPPAGTRDPEILLWCEEHDFHLVTNNRKSMPVHLAAHLAVGRHVPGIITLDLSEPTGLLLEELANVVQLALPGEYQDRIEYLPFR